MAASTEKIITLYAEAYQRLYNRKPKDLQMIDHEWVIVNGARMRIRELEYLTQQLDMEYSQSKEHKRSIIQRLVTWLKR